MSDFILFTFHFHSILEIYVMLMAHNPLKNAPKNRIINMWTHFFTKLWRYFKIKNLFYSPKLSLEKTKKKRLNLLNSIIKSRYLVYIFWHYIIIIIIIIIWGGCTLGARFGKGATVHPQKKKIPIWTSCDKWPRSSPKKDNNKKTRKKE